MRAYKCGVRVGADFDLMIQLWRTAIVEEHVKFAAGISDFASPSNDMAEALRHAADIIDDNNRQNRECPYEKSIVE